MKVRTAAEIIERLGGINAVGALTNRDYKAVHNWKAGNWFPARTYKVLNDELRERGLIAPASLWRMEQTEFATSKK